MCPGWRPFFLPKRHDFLVEEVCGWDAGPGTIRPSLSRMFHAICSGYLSVVTRTSKVVHTAGESRQRCCGLRHPVHDEFGCVYCSTILPQFFAWYIQWWQILSRTCLIELCWKNLPWQWVGLYITRVKGLNNECASPWQPTRSSNDGQRYHTIWFHRALDAGMGK